MKRLFPLAVAALAVSAGAAVLARSPAVGPDRIAFPRNFEADFVLCNITDRFDTKRARYHFINREALAKAEPGKPLPDGTILVMQDREVELDAAGVPVLDARGRMKTTGKTGNVGIMEKRGGWGQPIPASLRNGDWDYASYLASGERNPNVRNQDSCLTCHLARADRDWTFVAFQNVIDGIPKP
jgi:hemoglobin